MGNVLIKAPPPPAVGGNCCVFKSWEMTHWGLRTILRQQCAGQRAQTQNGQRPGCGELQAHQLAIISRQFRKELGLGSWQSNAFSNDSYYYNWPRYQGERNKEFLFFLHFFFARLCTQHLTSINWLDPHHSSMKEVPLSPFQRWALPRGS